MDFVLIIEGQTTSNNTFVILQKYYTEQKNTCWNMYYKTNLYSTNYSYRIKSSECQVGN